MSYAKMLGLDESMSDCEVISRINNKEESFSGVKVKYVDPSGSYFRLWKKEGFR